MVSRFDDFFQTEYINRNGSAFGAKRGEIAIDGGPVANIVYLTFEVDSSPVMSLAGNVFDMLPTGEDGLGSWLAGMDWSITEATIDARKRVRLEAVGVLGASGSSHVVIFEQIAAVMVPVVIHQTEEDSSSCVCFRYSLVPAPGGGAVPFPTDSVTIDCDDGGITLERSDFAHSLAPVAATDLRIPVPSDIVLRGSYNQLTPAEKSILDLKDPATWPQRLLDMIVIE